MSHSEIESARKNKLNLVKDKMLKRLRKLKAVGSDRQVVGYVRDTSEDLLDIEDLPDDALRL